jgi:hypothetical protein
LGLDAAGDYVTGLEARFDRLELEPMTRQDIVVKETTWQGDSMIAAEAYLSVEALLDDVRARRKEVLFYNQRIPSF